jgi:hypothetical protein
MRRLPRINFDMRQELSCRIDTIGARLSFACAFHCALTPVIVVVFPFLAVGGGSDLIHHGIILITIILSLLSSCWGFRRHKEWRLFFLSSLGIGLLALSQLSLVSHHRGNLNTLKSKKGPDDQQQNHPHIKHHHRIEQFVIVLGPELKNQITWL